MYSGEQEAQMITRVVISGSVFIVKLAGKEAMQMAKFLSAFADGELATSGEIKLKTLLKSGQPLKVFSLKGDENFISFARGASEYGIVYSVVKRTDQEKTDQLFDIMVKQSDASKINRVIEKYGLMQLQDSDNSAVVTGEYKEGTPDTEIRGADGTEGMPIEDIRALLAKMMESGSSQSDNENFTGVSESEDLSGTKSNYINNDEPEIIARVPGTPPEERPSIKAEIRQLTENRPADNTIGANPGILAQMMMPDDAEERDRLKYGMGIIRDAVNVSYRNILDQTGGDVTDEHTV